MPLKTWIAARNKKKLFYFAVFILFSFYCSAQKVGSARVKDREWFCPSFRDNETFSRFSPSAKWRQKDSINLSGRYYYGVAFGYETYKEDCMLSFATSASLYSTVNGEIEFDFPRIELKIYPTTSIKSGGLYQVQLITGVFMTNYFDIKRKNYFKERSFYVPFGIEFPFSVFGSETLRLEYDFNINGNSKFNESNTIRLEINWKFEQ
jgi:hypothetical protein